MVLRQFRIALSIQRRTFSLPQPTIQFQQNRCPHSVAQLEVRSSKHNVQFRPARISEGIDGMSSIVLVSSSAGTTGSPSGFSGTSSDETGVSSIYVSCASSACRFPLDICESGCARSPLRKVTRRYNNLIPRSTPRREYEGGREFGSSSVDDI